MKHQYAESLEPDGEKPSSLAVETHPPSPTHSHDTLAPISEEGSPVGDISRLSGFPELSQFNFGFGDDEPAPRSPTAYDRRPASVPQPALVLNPQNSRFSTPSRHHSAVLASPRQAQLPREIVAEAEEAPPPYTRFAEPHGHAGSSSQNLQQKLPRRPHPVHWIRSATRNLFPQRSSPEADPEVLRVPSMNSVTLADLRSGGEPDPEAARRRHGTRERRKGTWRGWWFCPSGGFLGFGQGPTSSEKRRKTRVMKCWAISGLIVVILVAIVVGVVMGVRSRSHNMPPKSENNSPYFPNLPLGNVVVRPFQRADRLSTCVARPYQWSCELPPDTKVPKTNATNDGFKVPEFRFTIKHRESKSASGPKSSWIPIPRNVPNIADYENVSAVDGVTDAGEDTDFYITLTASAGFQATDSQAGGKEFNDSKREIIKEESHMLPATAANQPLRLFDRGLDTEHYGFHLYFDKTIQFANSSRLISSRDIGGVSAEASRYRIQWSNTRFKVTIFTKKIAKVVESTLATEMGLPVDIWEDRVGGDRRGRIITAWHLDEKGTVGKHVGIAEKKGVSTEERGCFCHWSNYHDP
jgi:hypothetical protein